MLVGYARTSTAEQIAGLEDQVRQLEAAGCERVFREHGSGADNGRPELKKALQYVREGDALMVTSFDRLARSLPHLLEVVTNLGKEGVQFRSLREAVDTSSATGELILGIFGSLAQFERKLMLERQKVGIAKAKAAGKYKGRAPIPSAQVDEIHRLVALGVPKSKIAEKLGIGRATVYRHLDEE